MPGKKCAGLAGLTSAFDPGSSVVLTPFEEKML